MNELDWRVVEPQPDVMRRGMCVVFDHPEVQEIFGTADHGTDREYPVVAPRHPGARPDFLVPARRLPVETHGIRPRAVVLGPDLATLADLLGDDAP